MHSDCAEVHAEVGGAQSLGTSGPCHEWGDLILPLPPPPKRVLEVKKFILPKDTTAVTTAKTFIMGLSNFISIL